MAGTNFNNQTSKTPELLPLVQGSEEKFELILTEELLDKIKYLCAEFPTREWSGVLFYNFEGDVSNIEDLKLTAFDLYPLDLGTATYTEFSHSADFAGYIARHPELMDARQGLIHSHNNMSTFFSGTDTATLKEMSPEYGSYLSLIVNNAGTYTAAIGVTAKITTVVKAKSDKKITYKGLDYSDKEIANNKEEDKEDVKDVVLRFDAQILKEIAYVYNQEFIDSVEELKKNKAKQSYNNRTPSTVTPFSSPYGSPTVTPATVEFKGFTSTAPAGKQLNMFNKGDIEVSNDIMIEFITKLISQGYFYTVNQHMTFEAAVEEAAGTIPDGMTSQKYSVMVYEFIDMLLSYMEVTTEDDQAILVSSVMERLQPLTTKSEFVQEVYESLDSFLVQITEEYEEVEGLEETVIK